MTLVEWKKPVVNGNASRAAVYQHPFTGLLENVFGHDVFGREYASFVPAVNISEEDKRYVLELSAPGYNKSDFNIALEKGTLVISGKHSEEKEQKEKKFSRKEFNYGAFQRAFTLPDHVNENAISAAYQNGILTLELPKKQEEQVLGRQIVVN